MRLDHVFCMVDSAGDWERRLSEVGLVLDQGNRHRGQGTRNRRLFFGGLYLELLWVCDRAEAAGNPLRLDRRADWTRTGASPFGVGLRGQLPEQLHDQFWLYSDLGFPIWVQRGTPEHPMVFVIDPPPRQPENPSRTAASPTGMIHSIHLQAAATVAIPRYDGPAIAQTVGPARLDLVLDGGPDVDITDILALRTHHPSVEDQRAELISANFPLMDVDRVNVASLLDSLCAELGFCLPPEENNRLCISPPSDVDSFTDAVFVAEGMDPHGDKHLRELVRQKVIRAFRAG